MNYIDFWTISWWHAWCQTLHEKCRQQLRNLPTYSLHIIYVHIYIYLFIYVYIKIKVHIYIIYKIYIYKLYFVFSCWVVGLPLASTLQMATHHPLGSQRCYWDHPASVKGGKGVLTWVFFCGEFDHIIYTFCHMKCHDQIYIYIYHITVDTIWYDNIWYMKYNNLMEVENSCIWKVPTIEGTHFSLPWFWEEGYTYTLTKFDQFSKKKQEIKQKIRRQCFPTKGFQVLIQQTFHWKIGITNHQK